MNETALKGVYNMVKTMLPYEVGYTPKTTETKCFKQIIEVLAEHKPALKEFYDFFGYVCKKVDSSPESQKQLHSILINIGDIIKAYE